MQTIAETERKLDCPQCGHGMAIYGLYLGCLNCDSKLIPPGNVGIQLPIRELRLMFPERVSKRPSDATVRQKANVHPKPQKKLKSAPGQLDMFEEEK